MNRIRLIKLLGLLASAAAIATTAPAQLYTNLYQFEGNNQLYYGNNNSASPLTVIGSKLYGTTVGTAFSVNLDGSGYTSISNTNFYNSYYYGSYYYPATPNGLTVAGSTFYGTAQSGGTNYSGMVFSMSLDGSGFADLYDFSGIVGDGTSPQAAPTLVGATLYGTTYGGANGAGMIFSINTNGTGYADLYDFGTIVSDGNSPVATLRAIGSTLYGTTPGGGANSAGTIFSINTNGTGYTILYDFGSSLNDGSSPGGLLQVGSKFYGTTKGGGTWNYYGNGTIYSLNTAGGLVKKSFVDHTPYSTSSVLRTIELILGLPPMSQYDASAEPLWRCFDASAGHPPFQARLAQTDLFEKNTAFNDWQRKSEEFNFGMEDRAPDRELNEVIWVACRGTSKPCPPPVHAAFVRTGDPRDD